MEDVSRASPFYEEAPDPLVDRPRDAAEDGTHYPGLYRVAPDIQSPWGCDVGQAIMVGSLATVLVVIVGLVLRFDPEARGADDREHD